MFLLFVWVDAQNRGEMLNMRQVGLYTRDLVDGDFRGSEYLDSAVTLATIGLDAQCADERDEEGVKFLMHQW